MFSFAATGKPNMYLTYDMEHFQAAMPCFSFDLAEPAPTPLLRSSAELVEALADLAAVVARSADRDARCRETFCALEDGHAAERVLDLISPAGTVPSGSVNSFFFKQKTAYEILA